MNPMAERDKGKGRGGSTVHRQAVVEPREDIITDYTIRRLTVTAKT